MKKKKKRLPPKKPAPKKTKTPKKRANFPKKVVSWPKQDNAKWLKAVKKKAVKKKTVKKTAKPKPKPAAKKKKSLYITVNDQRVGVKSGLKRTHTGLDIVHFTGVKPEKAILRRNGERISVYEKYTIRRGDVYTVKEYTKPRKKHRQRPAPPSRDIRKHSAESLVKNYRWLRAHEEAILASHKGHKKVIPFEPPPGVWVNAMDEKFTKHDGASASWESSARSHPMSEHWYEQMKRLEKEYGYDSAELRAYMEDVAEKANCDIQEVFTLLMSH